MALLNHVQLNQLWANYPQLLNLPAQHSLSTSVYKLASSQESNRERSLSMLASKKGRGRGHGELAHSEYPLSPDKKKTP